MRTLAADFLIPLCSALVAAATAAELTKKTAPAPLPGRFAERITGKLKGNRLALTLVGVTGGLQLAAFLLIDLLLSQFTVGETVPKSGLAGSSGMDWFPMLLVSVCGFAALLCAMYGRGGRLFRFLRSTAVTAAVLLLAECFFFGAKSLTADPHFQVLSQFTLGDNAEIAEDTSLRFSGDTAFIECTPSQGTRAVSLRLKKEDVNRMLTVTAFMKDDNFSKTYQQVNQRYVAGNGESFTLNLDPFVKIHSLKLQVSNIGDPVTVCEIAESTAPPFRFMTLRFLLLFLFIMTVCAVRIYELHRIVYDRKKTNHRLVLTLITAACMLSPLVFVSQQNLIDYDMEADNSGLDVFAKTFDALQHGQTSLRMDVSAELAAMSDTEVYDNSSRDTAGVGYAWDHAYKDGKYYSYFGITPIVTMYYPVYWLTHKLPTLRLAILIYAIFAALFICRAVIAAVTLLVKKPNLLLLCLSLPAAVMTAGIFYSLQSVSIYVLPLCAAICFLMLALWQGFAGCMPAKGRRLKQYLHFAVSGLALGFSAGARPSTTIPAVILIPLFLGVLLNKQEKWKQKLLKAGAFALPLFVIVTGLLTYNHARFGSFFDFGAQYQLTVSNINANQLRLYALPDGIYHYMLQPPDFKGTFPFIGYSWQGLPNYERYRFTYLNFGILWVPMLALSVLLLRTVCKRGCETPYQGVTALQKKAVLLTGFAALCLVAWMDFCLAGNGAQYIFDLAPAFCIFAAVVLLSAANPDSELRYRVIWLACVSSVLLFVLLLISSRDGPMHENYPLLWERAESLFVFWH